MHLSDGAAYFSEAECDRDLAINAIAKHSIAYGQKCNVTDIRSGAERTHSVAPQARTQASPIDLNPYRRS